MQKLVKYPDLFFRVVTTISLIVGFLLPIVGIGALVGLVIYKQTNHIKLAREEWTFTLVSLILLSAFFMIVIYLNLTTEVIPNNSETIRTLFI